MRFSMCFPDVYETVTEIRVICLLWDCGNDTIL